MARAISKRASRCVIDETSDTRSGNTHADEETGVR